jgi:predicted RNA-binding Zn-ribbon protein involved in translation (DUF1610 family)
LFYPLPKSRRIVKKGELKSNIIPANLKCPKCSFEGIATYKKKGFKVLGKNEEGYLYFECPKCESHLKYDGLTRAITIVKG